MFEDYSERLFSHFVAGRWRVPFAMEPLILRQPGGHVLGQIVPANPQDIERACQALRAVDADACARAADVVAASLDSLVAAHRYQTGQQIALPEIKAFAEAIKGRNRAGRRILLSVPDVSDVGVTPGASLGAALGAGLRGGLVWCPPPEMAFFATRFAELMQQADLPPGGFALLHAQTPGTQAAFRLVADRFG